MGIISDVHSLMEIIQTDTANSGSHSMKLFADPTHIPFALGSVQFITVRCTSLVR